MVNGIAFISHFYPKWFTVLPHIHPFIHQRRRCQPCKVTTNRSGAVRVRWCLTLTAPQHLARMGSPGIKPATFQLLFSPELLPPSIVFIMDWQFMYVASTNNELKSLESSKSSSTILTSFIQDASRSISRLQALGSRAWMLAFGLWCWTLYLSCHWQ